MSCPKPSSPPKKRASPVRTGEGETSILRRSSQSAPGIEPRTVVRPAQCRGGLPAQAVRLVLRTPDRGVDRAQGARAPSEGVGEPTAPSRKGRAGGSRSAGRERRPWGAPRIARSVAASLPAFRTTDREHEGVHIAEGEIGRPDRDRGESREAGREKRGHAPIRAARRPYDRGIWRRREWPMVLVPVRRRRHRVVARTGTGIARRVRAGTRGGASDRASVGTVAGRRCERPSVPRWQGRQTERQDGRDEPASRAPRHDIDRSRRIHLAPHPPG